MIAKKLYSFLFYTLLIGGFFLADQHIQIAETESAEEEILESEENEIKYWDNTKYDNLNLGGNGDDLSPISVFNERSVTVLFFQNPKINYFGLEKFSQNNPLYILFCSLKLNFC